LRDRGITFAASSTAFAILGLPQAALAGLILATFVAVTPPRVTPVGAPGRVRTLTPADTGDSLSSPFPAVPSMPTSRSVAW